MSEQLGIPRQYRAPKTAGDDTTSLELLIDHLERDILLRPKHQRSADAWPVQKKREYVEGLLQAGSGCHPPGSIATYQIVDDDGTAGPEYLNDGLQRLTTLRELKADPSQFALDDAAVDALLRNVRISVQHRLYKSHEEAMVAFQRLNYGSHLTAYEIGRGLFVHIPRYDEDWEPLLAEIHGALRDAAARLRGRMRSEKGIEHKHLRHNLALFHRFVVGEQRAVDYVDVGRMQIQDLLASGQVTEQRLKNVFVSRGVDDIEPEVRRFKGLVQREVALLEQVRNETLGAGHGLQAGLWRWLLDFAVWCKNTRTPVEEQRQFIVATLKAGNGRGRWEYDEGGSKSVTLGLSRLSLLPGLAERAGMPTLCDRKRRTRTIDTRDGYHESHVLPFATHGDGPTFAEPASINMARGAKPA